MRVLLVLCLIVVLSTKALAINISNLIVFGDSYSDIGNFPESHQVKQSNGSLRFNFYVPISNPVDISEQFYTLPNNPLKYSFPNLNNGYYNLPQQPTIKNLPRNYRSSNWSEYLLHAAEIKHLTASQGITPWINTFNRMFKVSQTTSVDYAWAGALTIAACANENYTLMPQAPCTAVSINSAQSVYRVSGNETSDYFNVQVPGVVKQVDLLLDDVNHHKVIVGDNTAYIVWTGSNDLSKAFKLFIAHPGLRGLWEMILDLYRTIPNNISDVFKKLITTPQIHAKHIYVVNLFDLGLTPEAASIMPSMPKVTEMIANLLVRYFNYRLNQIIQHEQLTYPDVSIHLYDVHQDVSSLASLPAYQKNTLAHQRCENSSLVFAAGGALKTNCGPDKSEGGYLFWNDAHPTTIMEQYIAHSLLQEIEKTWDNSARKSS